MKNCDDCLFMEKIKKAKRHLEVMNTIFTEAICDVAVGEIWEDFEEVVKILDEILGEVDE